MVELFAGSRGMAMVNQAMLSWYPLHDELVEGAVEGFLFNYVNQLRI
jgi:hypothetical protein